MCTPENLYIQSNAPICSEISSFEVAVLKRDTGCSDISVQEVGVCMFCDRRIGFTVKNFKLIKIGYMYYPEKLKFT